MCQSSLRLREVNASPAAAMDAITNRIGSVLSPVLGDAPLEPLVVAFVVAVVVLVVVVVVVASVVVASMVVASVVVSVVVSVVAVSSLVRVSPRV